MKEKMMFVKFVCKKAIFYLFVLFCAISLVIILPRLMPGNPVDLMIAPSAGAGIMTGPGAEGLITPLVRIREAMLAHFGLDKPLHIQYVHAWRRIFQWDFGPSYHRYPIPVGRLISDALPFTLALVVPVALISFFFGNGLGAKSAFLKGKWNGLVYYTTLVTSRMPFFWFAMVLIFLLAVKSGWFPLHGWISPGRIAITNLGDVLNIGHHFVLPFISMLLGSIGIWSVGMRSMIIYEMNSDYILYSEQLGFKKNSLRRYAQRNAILPQFTGFNLIFSALIGQTMITEIVFGWPGLGILGLRAVLNLDFPLLLGVFLFTIVIVVVGNFAVDVVYGFLDPRIRSGSAGGT